MNLINLPGKSGNTQYKKDKINSVLMAKIKNNIKNTIIYIEGISLINQEVTNMGKMKELDYVLRGFSEEKQREFNDILYNKKPKIHLKNPKDIKFYQSEFEDFYPFFFESENE